MPTTDPLSFNNGSPVVGSGTEGAELMEGIPPAGPSAMGAPAPLTAPGVQCSAIDVPPAGTKLRVRSGEPPLMVVPSAKGATGRSTGTVTNAMSDALSVATTVAGSNLPPGPTMTRFLAPTRRLAVVA